MLALMSEEHFAEFYQPPLEYCGDNGAMIAWMGQLMYQHKMIQNIKDTTVKQRYRTDEVNVPWMKTLRVGRRMYRQGRSPHQSFA